ncbi:hypothetical protein GCM10017711_36680 [Paeniglutamicibacter sulfureus]
MPERAGVGRHLAAGPLLPLVVVPPCMTEPSHMNPGRCDKRRFIRDEWLMLDELVIRLDIA